MLKGFLKTWQILLDILFPAICLHCRAYLQTPEEKENLLCRSCFSNIKIYSNIFYPHAGLMSLVAIGSYEEGALKELIHYFKYSGFLAARVPLEKLISQWLEINRSLVPNILTPGSCLVPIPLHKNRLRHRGFNQAELIGELISKHLNLPLQKDALRRVRDTKPQVAIKIEKEREENLKNSFQLNPKKTASLTQYQNVVLIDDVYTSGSTIREAIKTLRQAGVKNITAFVVAKT